MIFLGNLNKITDSKYEVNLIHRVPFDLIDGLGKTIEELEKEGILVDEIPEQVQISGKRLITYIDTQTKVITYEYEDIPKTQDHLTEERISMLEQAINDLILGGM